MRAQLATGNQMSRARAARVIIIVIVNYYHTVHDHACHGCSLSASVDLAFERQILILDVELYGAVNPWRPAIVTDIA